MSIKSNKLHNTANASRYLLSFVWKEEKVYYMENNKGFLNSIWLLPTLLYRDF